MKLGIVSTLPNKKSNKIKGRMLRVLTVCKALGKSRVLAPCKRRSLHPNRGSESLLQIRPFKENGRWGVREQRTRLRERALALWIRPRLRIHSRSSLVGCLTDTRLSRPTVVRPVPAGPLVETLKRTETAPCVCSVVARSARSRCVERHHPSFPPCGPP